MQSESTEAITAPANADRTFYDAETHYLEDAGFVRSYVPVLESYMASYRPLLARRAGNGPKLRVLELGAGSCLTSLLLSREPWVASIHCMDISSVRMKTSIETLAKRVGGRSELLSFGEADFSYPLPLPDSVFDVVVFDSALHHTRNIWLTLQECHRVLAPGGQLVAQREQYLGRWTSRPVLHRILRSREVRSGVSENAYLREQYEYYLRATGFRPQFFPVSYGNFRFVSFLNGLLFSKWTMVAERRPVVPVLD